MVISIQWAHVMRIALCWRRHDAMASGRRWYGVLLVPSALWDFFYCLPHFLFLLLTAHFITAYCPFYNCLPPLFLLFFSFFSFVTFFSLLVHFISFSCFHIFKHFHVFVLIMRFHVFHVLSCFLLSFLFLMFVRLFRDAAKRGYR